MQGYVHELDRANTINQVIKNKILYMSIQQLFTIIYICQNGCYLFLFISMDEVFPDKEKHPQFKHQPIKFFRSSSCQFVSNKTNPNLQYLQNHKKVVLKVQRKISCKINQDINQNDRVAGEGFKVICEDSTSDGLNFETKKNGFQQPRKLTIKKRQKNECVNENYLQTILQIMCSNHKETMKILQKITNRKCCCSEKSKQSCKNVQNISSQDILSLQSQPQFKCILNGIKQQGNIKLPLNNKMAGSYTKLSQQAGNKQNKFNKLVRLSSLCERNSFLQNLGPVDVANLLVKAINQSVFIKNSNVNQMEKQKIELRQLISRRFHAFNKNYNHFLSQLLKYGKSCFNIQQINTILSQAPFLLQENQINIVKKEIFMKKKGKQPQIYSFSDFAQKMRYFIQDYTVLNQDQIQIKMIEFGNIMREKREEFQQHIGNICGEGKTVNLYSLENIFKDLRILNSTIQIVLSKLCVNSKSINEISFQQLLDQQWIQSLWKQIKQGQQ